MSRAAPPNGSSTMLPNAPPMLYPYDLGYKFNASMAIIVVVLVTTFFFMALFILYLRRCNMGAGRGAAGGGGAALQRQQQQQRLHHHGIEPEVLAKFPLIRYASIKAPKKGKAGVECAVCLLQFEDNEKLRLLPPCGHLFHAECIDMWLQTHSTCPLCRRNLDGGDSASGHLQRALSAVVNSFRRDSNSNSLAEGRAAAAEADLEAHEEDEAEVGSQRHREIVRTLSKNSESFKMAAHDQELRELREKLRATSARFTKDTDPATRESFSRFKSFLSFRTTAPPTIHHSQSCTLLVDDNDAEFESTKTQQPKEAPADDAHDHPSAALRRSVSDGESFSILQQHKLWMGESSTPSSNSINPETNNRPAFRAFARRSLKWLVGIKDSSSSAASNNGSEENHTGLMQQQQVEK